MIIVKNLKLVDDIKVGMAARFKCNGTMFPEATYEGIISNVTDNHIIFWGLPIKETMKNAAQMELGLLGSARRVPVRYSIRKNTVTNDDIKLWIDDNQKVNKSVKSLVEYTEDFLMNIITQKDFDYDYDKKLKEKIEYYGNDDQAKEMIFREKQNNANYIYNVFRALEVAIEYKGNIIEDYLETVKRLLSVMNICVDEIKVA